MALADWVEIGLTMMSMGGAGFSWWKAHRSNEAKEKAETARDETQRKLDAAVRQAAAAEATARGVESLVENLTAPPLTVAWLGKSQFAVRNTTPREMIVTSRSVDGSDDAVVGLEVGTVIRAHQSIRGFVEETLADPWTAGLELGIEGRDAPVYLSFGDRPL